MLRNTILAFALFAGTVTAAYAGDQFIDDTGYAVSGYDVVSYFDLPQSSVGEPQQSPLRVMPPSPRTTMGRLLLSQPRRTVTGF